jgi:hypothetical protein
MTELEPKIRSRVLFWSAICPKRHNGFIRSVPGDLPLLVEMTEGPITPATTIQLPCIIQTVNAWEQVDFEDQLRTLYYKIYAWERKKTCM